MELLIHHIKIIRTTYPIVLGFMLLILVGLTSCNNPSKSTPESILKGEIGDTLDRELTPLIEQIMRGYDLPGVAVGIVKENEIVYARAFGYSNIDTREALTIQSLFHMASISKTFVATAIMQLVEEGKVNLDSSLVHYLPYFKMLWGPYEKITIKHILSHMSGMPDVGADKWDHPVNHKGALEYYVRTLASQEMIGPPGERFSYSSMAFECLGDVVSKVSGMPFEKYVKKHILNPIGMKESTFLKPDQLPDHWTNPHINIVTTKVLDPYPYNRMHGPSSTLHSNVVEMCYWAMANLNRGTLMNHRILNSSSYDLLWKKWANTGVSFQIGLSWLIGEIRNLKTISHSGADMGFYSDFIMIPDQALAVVVLCNMNPAPVRVIQNIALDLLLGYAPPVLKLPASVPVLKELDEQGVDEAVLMWDSLKIHHSEKYEFGHQLFSGMLLALRLDLVEEAVTIIRLCLEIFPEEIIYDIEERTIWHRDHNLQKNAANAVLNIIQQKYPGDQQIQ